MKSSDKLIGKIKTDTGLEVENIKRTYAGINMRICGAWVWKGNIKGTHIEVGSVFSISELLKKDTINYKKDHLNSFGFDIF